MLTGCVIPSFDSGTKTSDFSSSSSAIPNPSTSEPTSIPTSESSSSTSEFDPWSTTTGHIHQEIYQEENRVEPTCTEDGSFEGVTYCPICGLEFSRVTYTIPKLGHDYIHHAGKAATCDEDGYKDYDTCSRCDYSTYEVIPALGHNFGDPEYAWSEDYSTCTAKRVCLNDINHFEEETVVASYDIEKEATSSEEGIGRYTAIFTNPNFEEQYQDISIPKLVFPTFTINTVDNTPITSKEEYFEGSLDISNAGKYDDSNLALGIRGRGNYSWSGTEKKSYRIKFNSKYQPLGQGKGPCKSWTLLAVHCDKSLLRTDAAFYFASKLSHIPFVSSSSFIDLYLNGEYQGVYELCDQIQVNKYRVNIDDSGEETDIGYLAELDKNASEDVVTLDSWMTFELKSDYVNESQMAFITNYLNQVDNALYDGNKNTILSLIDIDSAVDSYLVEELFKNLDVGWGSFYYTKPKGDKLYFGPVWDFDLTSGNADSDNADSRFRSYMYTYVGNDYFNYMQQHDWYCYLRELDWFNELINQRWQEIKEYATDTVQYIKDMAHKYHDCFNKNFERWDIFDQKINREPTVVMNIKTFQGQVDYLTNWLTNRINWLDKYYAGQVQDL